MKISIPFILSAIFLILTEAALDDPKKVLKIPILQRNNGHKLGNKFRSRDNSQISLFNAASKEYIIEVGFGTPPQKFNVTFDTGSSDIWIPANTCSASMCPLTRFNEESSSTFKQLKDELDIEYGIGTAKGTYGLDTITIGPASISNHTIGLVNDTANLIYTSTMTEPSNGILGLAFPSLSLAPGKPNHFVSDLYANKVISAPIFSVFLNKPFEFGYAGELTIGGTDTARYTGDIQYAPVVSFDLSQYYISPNLGANRTTADATYLYWSVPGQGITTSTGYTYTSPKLESFILDTGTTLTYVPPAVAENIVSSVIKNTSALTFDSINGVYTVDCKLSKRTNTTVNFLVSSSDTAASSSPIQIKIPLSALIIPLDDALTPRTSKQCMFGIAPSPPGLNLTTGDTYILGETTMRAFYAVFDLQQNRVGIAQLSNINSTHSSKPGKTTASSSRTTTSSDKAANNAMVLSPSQVVFFFTALIALSMY